jgi:hypothetical protein
MRAQQAALPVRALVSAFVAFVLVSGCGGVDSGGTGAVAVGPISGFGSVVVNGVRFDDAGAVILDDDGAPIGRDRLQLGVMTQIDASAPVNVAGSLRATARSVRIGSELVGPASAVDPAGNTFAVLGQTVLVTPATVFGPSFAGGLANLPGGSVVEVFGRYDAAYARYTATRIDAMQNPAAYKLRGPISAIDQAAHTLTIGGQSIDYSGVSQADMSNIVVGTIVRAKLSTAAPSGAWVALAVSAGVSQLPDSDETTLEGRISAWTSSRQFSVDGIAVDASAAGFPDGEAGVVLGARVSVEGASTAGLLHARSVEIEGDEDQANSIFELHGAVEAIDSVGKTFVLHGVVVDYSGPVTYTSGTVDDLLVGRQVDVSGGLSGDGTGVKAQQITFAP